MRVEEGEGDLPHSLDRDPRRHVPLVDRVGKVLAREDLHRVERRAVRKRPDIVDADDVRVLERRGSPRLPLEAVERLGRHGHAKTEDLERHLAPEDAIPRAVDDAHPSAPERLDHLVPLSDAGEPVGGRRGLFAPNRRRGALPHQVAQEVLRGLARGAVRRRDRLIVVATVDHGVSCGWRNGSTPRPVSQAIGRGARAAAITV